MKHGPEYFKARERVLASKVASLNFLERIMQVNKQFGHIHPLMAGAAVSVMLVSLVGAAAITGILPTSHGTAAPATVPAAASVAADTGSAASRTAPPTGARTEEAHPRQVVHHHVVHHAAAPQYVEQTPEYVQHPVPVAAPAPVAQNSAVGIGVGAVLGGLLGSQVGGGRGRTLSTIAGAVGGGYVGNEIAKRNP